MMQNTISDASEVEAGYSASILTALTASEVKNELTGQSLSPMSPIRILPTAEEKLNAATRAAPI